mgnify:CR=1 FL=1
MGSRDKLITTPVEAVKTALNIGKKSDSFEEIDYVADLAQNRAARERDIQKSAKIEFLKNHNVSQSTLDNPFFGYNYKDMVKGYEKDISNAYMSPPNPPPKDPTFDELSKMAEEDIAEDALFNSWLNKQNIEAAEAVKGPNKIYNRPYDADPVFKKPKKPTQTKKPKETKKKQDIVSLTNAELKKIYKLDPDKNPDDIAPFQVLTQQARGLYQKDPDNFLLNLKNKDKKIISSLDEALETYTPGIEQLYEIKNKLTSKGSKTREKLVKIAQKFMPKASQKKIEESLLDFSHVFGFKATGDVNRQSKFLDIGGSPDVMYLSPSYANRSIQRSLEGQIKKLITANRIKPNDKLGESIQRLQNLLEKIKAVSYITMRNNDNIDVAKFGYDAKETVGKYKAPRFTDDEYEELFEYLLEAQPDSKMTLQKKSPYKGILFNEGGMARRMMAIGGDMSQFTETEEVVSTPDGMEGQVDLAMSFKNPFKIKKPPPLFDESTSNLKISGAVDDIKATETVTDTNKGIFTLKSETEIMNSPQESMVGGQWLGFLKKKGVSPTELDEFGLGNYLTANQNVKINKNDLINAYKDLKPIITYDIHQKEPFQKGLDDFGSFLTRRDSGGGYYHGTRNAGVEEIRGLNNKPQDIAGDAVRVQLAELFKGSAQSGEIMDQGAGIINKVFKQFYGIDNVLKNGIPEGSKIPFYSKTIVERFKRLHSGEGFYMSKKTPKHEGVQFLPGGTGYIEIPITYNPNPKGPRAKEPAYTEGAGHFANTKGNHPVFWMRASERTDEAGRRVLFIEEIQSDLHQGVQQKGKKYSPRLDEPGKVNISALNSQRIKLADELNKITEQIDKVKGHTDPSTQTVLARLQTKRYSIREELNTINKQLDEMDMTAEGVPEAPFKKSENQAKIAIKIALNLARENGYDGVVMISGKAKNYGANASGTNAKGNLGFYNNIATKAMKNAAKNNGLDFSSTNIKDGKGNTWAKLPYINIKGTPTQPVDMYKNTGGYIHYPSFVDVVPTL